MTDIAEHKRRLRRELIARRAAIAGDERRAWSLAACDRALSVLDVRADDIVSAFWPLDGELDCRPLLRELAARQVRTALPHTPGRGRPLVFRSFCDGDPLQEAAFGVMEPDSAAAIVEPDIVVVPLLGFDRHCNRIGYGGGFYDRTIAALRRAGKARVTIGLAFECQYVVDLPLEPTDISLDAVVTEVTVRTGPRS